MRRAVAMMTVWVAAWGSGSAVNACGDKFLVIGRALKRVPRSTHPASIVLYLKSDSSLQTAGREMRLEATLKQAGHSVDVAEDSATLHQLLSSRRYDVVVADLPDARAIRATSRGSIVVPIAYHPTSQQLTDARREFGRIVKAPEKGVAFLTVIDRAAQDASRAR